MTAEEKSAPGGGENGPEQSVRGPQDSVLEQSASRPEDSRPEQSVSGPEDSRSEQSASGSEERTADRQTAHQRRELAYRGESIGLEGIGRVQRRRTASAINERGQRKGTPESDSRVGHKWKREENTAGQRWIMEDRQEKDYILGACYRGCRLFSICHFVDVTADLNTTKVECESACIEAYAKTDYQYCCTTGCRKQLIEVENQKEKLLDFQIPSSFNVFDLISGFCSDLVSSAQSFVSSTWTFYLQSEDGKVVVFQSQPEVEYPELQDPRSKVTDKNWLSSPFNAVKPHTGIRERAEKTSGKESKMKHELPNLETAQSEHDFLGCMSKCSGLPRWILAACLFLSIMVLLWLSCASLVTAPDQHIKAQENPGGYTNVWDLL